MGKLGRLGHEPPQRYERARPGELIHIDVKKLGRITGGAGKRITGGHGRNPRRTRTDAAGVRRNTRGWEAVHIAIDNATRLAYVEVLPDEKAGTAIAFLRRAVAFYQRHGIAVERLLTDNGSPLPLRDPRDRLQSARHPPSAHQALQPSPPTLSPRATDTHHPPEQPARVLHLGLLCLREDVRAGNLTDQLRVIAAQMLLRPLPELVVVLALYDDATHAIDVLHGVTS